MCVWVGVCIDKTGSLYIKWVVGGWILFELFYIF